MVSSCQKLESNWKECLSIHSKYFTRKQSDQWFGGIFPKRMCHHKTHRDHPPLNVVCVRISSLGDLLGVYTQLGRDGAMYINLPTRGALESGIGFSSRPKIVFFFFFFFAATSETRKRSWRKVETKQKKPSILEILIDVLKLGESWIFLKEKGEISIKACPEKEAGTLSLWKNSCRGFYVRAISSHKAWIRMNSVGIRCDPPVGDLWRFSSHLVSATLRCRSGCLSLSLSRNFFSFAFLSVSCHFQGIY